MRHVATPGWALTLASCALLAGCGRHPATVAAPAKAGAGIPHGPIQTAAVGSSAPGSGAPAAATGARLRLTGPGPRRVEPGALEVTALAFALENLGPDPLEVRGLSLLARGSLDDPSGVATARLALDQDGDGRFDRAVDRVLASGGLAHDDGPLSFTLAPLPLAAGDALRGLVTIDLASGARAGDTFQLVLEGPTALVADAPGGVALEAAPAAGPLLRVGRWTTPRVAFELAGEGLRPHAVRDEHGRTHVACYQNAGTSDVFYTVFDGRSFSPPDDVANSADTAWNAHLALGQGGLPHLVWEQWDRAGGGFVVRATRFDPVAFGWAPSELVSSGPGLRPQARVLAGALHVVWHDQPGPDQRVRHRVRDGAGRWSTVAEVTSAAAGARASEPALAALPGDRLAIAWCENDVARSEVRLREWTSAGYGPIEVVASAAQPVEQAALLADGATLHLAFVSGGEVFHQRRGPSGWSQPLTVSRSPAVDSSRPALALHQGRLQVVWVEDDLALARSMGTAKQLAHAEEVGGGFSPVQLLTRGAGTRDHPTVVSEGARLRVLWQDFTLGRHRIFETWREPGGLEAPATVAAPGGEPSRPAAAFTPSGALAAAWSVEAGGSAEVFVALGDASGAFSLPENASRSANGSYRPTLAAQGDGLWAAWEEDARGGFAVYAARRDASGSWSSPAPVSSATPAYAPALASGPRGELALVWTEPGSAGDHALRVRLGQGAGLGPSTPLGSLVPGARAWSPHAAFDARGALHVVFEREDATGRAVLLATRAPSGATRVAAVASGVAGQYAPRVACAGEDVHVVWVEDGRVRAATRPGGASAFLPPIELSPGGCWSVDVAVLGGEGHGRAAALWTQHAGADARPMLALADPSGAWSTPAALDLARGPSQRTALAGSPTGGLAALWVEPGRVVLRACGEE